jgi:hypothetical protein
MAFAPGRVVLHRNTRRGRLGFARPTRVVSDDERGLLLWMPRGTISVHEVAADGRTQRSMPFSEWVTLGYRLDHGTWLGPGILLFFPSGAEHSVWFSRTDEGTFTGWYVNLEEHAVRWDDGDTAGIDVVDQDLDIVVAPDRTWQWKDEDEFTERLAFPDHYWVRDEAAVRAEGHRVIKQIEAADFPFDGTWTDWTVPPGWEIPAALPAGWDRPVVAL